MRRWKGCIWALIGTVCFAALSPTSGEVRVKDVTSVRGIRVNQLIGYGLVTGLKGTGDSLKNSPFTEQSMTSMLERVGVNTRGLNIRSRNVAAVLVTAELPAFAAVGNRIDITVTSLGDASSLAGGMLILTPLGAANGQIYAVAQGALTVSGFEAKGQNEAVTLGVPTTGRVAGGAIIERDAPNEVKTDRSVKLDLNNPDYATSVAIADAINEFTTKRYKSALARESGPSSVAVDVPAGQTPARFISQIGMISFIPDAPARIVVDERTGTIVISRNVKVSRVAVTHGNLTVRVTENPTVSQPEPFSKGQTVVTSETKINAFQEKGNFAVVDGVDLQSVVSGLNRLGLKPHGIIAILQAIKSTGALQADLIVQ